MPPRVAKRNADKSSDSAAVAPASAKERKSTGKRSADKISESADTSETADVEPAKKTVVTSTEVTRSEFEQNVLNMKAEAEERRLKVLNDYLKENQGKTIVVTQPPPKVVKVKAVKPTPTVKPTPKPAKSSGTPTPKPTKSTPKSATKFATKSATKAAPPAKLPSASSSSSSSSAPKNTTSLLPKKLASLDETQLLTYLQTEIKLSSKTSASFKKEKVDGMYLRGLWLHRNDIGMKERIANIFQKICPDDKDFAMLIHVLSSNALRM